MSNRELQRDIADGPIRKTQRRTIRLWNEEDLNFKGDGKEMGLVRGRSEINDEKEEEGSSSGILERGSGLLNDERNTNGKANSL